MALALSVTQPAPPSCSEHDLVAAVRCGNDRAFEELFGRYWERIGSYVFGMLGDQGRAEDIAQEVFMSALRRLRDTESPIALKPWIYQIARNACVDEFRRTRRAKEVPLESSDEHEGVDHVIASHTPTPDAAVESKQRLDDLRDAFRGLSESHHRVLVMRELEGLSYEQIGERLGMSKPIVESTLFRARRRLTDEYDELVSGRRCERVQTLIAAGGERPLRSLGLRERRQFARHVAHCQPCRRHARMAGVDDSLFQTPGLIGKIAALFPFPWLRWRRSRTDKDTIAAAGSHQMVALQSLPAVAQLADPTGPLAGLGRAAATAAAIVIVGAGGGVVAGLGGHGRLPSTGAATRHSHAPAAAATAVRNVRSRARGLATGATPTILGTTTAAAAPKASSAGPTASAGSTASGGGDKKSGSGSALPGLTSGAASLVQHSAAGAAAAAATKGAGLGGLQLPVLGGSGTSGTGLPKLPGVSLPPLPTVSTPKLPPLPTVSTPKLPPLPTVSTRNLALATVNTPGLPALPAVSVPGLPAVPAVSVPALPALPAVSGPKVPAVPAVSAPKVPAVPAVSAPAVSAPKVPAVPAVSVPALPAVPAASAPNAPAVAAVSTPNVPKVPAVPAVSTPNVPAVPLPKLPVPSVPNPGGIVPKLGSS